MMGAGQYGGQGREVISCRLSQLSTGDGQGAEEHVVPGYPLYGLDKHGIHPQPDALGDLVPVQVLDMVVYDQQGSGLVDAIVSILLGQQRLLGQEEGPGVVQHDDFQDNQSYFIRAEFPIAVSSLGRTIFL